MSLDRLPESRNWQLTYIAAAAVAISVVTAVAVLIIIRRQVPSLDISVVTDPESRSTAGDGSASLGTLSPAVAAAQPAISSFMEPEVPHHFSEDLLIPGLTYTGPEIAQQDDETGRSPEGV